jgi:hypothetical protein
MSNTVEIAFISSASADISGFNMMVGGGRGNAMTLTVVRINK